MARQVLPNASFTLSLGPSVHGNRFYGITFAVGLIARAGKDVIGGIVNQRSAHSGR